MATFHTVASLIERFDITPREGSGERMVGRLWQAGNRRTGRRITVHSIEGVELFDSDDHYDLGNARNALENWLKGRGQL